MRQQNDALAACKLGPPLPTSGCDYNDMRNNRLLEAFMSGSGKSEIREKQSMEATEKEEETRGDPNLSGSSVELNEGTVRRQNVTLTPFTESESGSRYGSKSMDTALLGKQCLPNAKAEQSEDHVSVDGVTPVPSFERDPQIKLERSTSESPSNSEGPADAAQLLLALSSRAPDGPIIASDRSLSSQTALERSTVVGARLNERKGTLRDELATNPAERTARQDREASNHRLKREATRDSVKRPSRSAAAVSKNRQGTSTAEDRTGRRFKTASVKINGRRSNGKNAIPKLSYRFGPGQPSASSQSSEKSLKNSRQKSCAYVGVRRRQWGTYAAEIRNQGTGAREWLGTFESPEEAAVVYDARLRQIKGPGAKCNFPPLDSSGDALKREICPHGKSSPQRLTLLIPANWKMQVARFHAGMEEECQSSCKP